MFAKRWRRKTLDTLANGTFRDRFFSVALLLVIHRTGLTQRLLTLRIG